MSLGSFTSRKNIMGHGWTRIHTDKTQLMAFLFYFLSLSIRVHPWPDLFCEAGLSLFLAKSAPQR